MRVYQVYQLTTAERRRIENLNEASRDGKLLIVCDLSDIGLGCVVHLDDLEDTVEYPSRREQVDATLDIARIHELEEDTDGTRRVR